MTTLQTMILNRTAVTAKRKFNLMKGLKSCYADIRKIEFVDSNVKLGKHMIDEVNDFFGLYNTHDKLWFYTPYAIIYLMVVIVNSKI